MKRNLSPLGATLRDALSRPQGERDLVYLQTPMSFDTFFQHVPCLKNTQDERERVILMGSYFLQLVQVYPNPLTLSVRRSLGVGWMYRRAYAGKAKL